MYIKELRLIRQLVYVLSGQERLDFKNIEFLKNTDDNIQKNTNDFLTGRFFHGTKLQPQNFENEVLIKNNWIYCSIPDAKDLLEAHVIRLGELSRMVTFSILANDYKPRYRPLNIEKQ